ncbi:MAG: hypothetical protein JRD93_08540 [Deltaproteobacteria bacterium]|nr:hypothetical protein [Deltaproteobacteria bacterium]MBW2662015.1 hypothetical protein [Deltaproteobacteria bacterium]
MKNIKIVFWLIIVVLLMVFAFQNQDVITAKQGFRLNLMAFDEYHTPEIPNAVIYLSCFLIGFLIAFLGDIVGRLKNRKVVKEQKAVVDSQQEEIFALKSKLESSQSISLEPLESSQNIPLESVENNKEINEPS